MIAMMAAAAFACGCAVSHKTVVKPGDAPAKLLNANKDDLIERYDQQAQSVTSLNATVSMKLIAGSAYSGVIEQYHQVNGFILAAKPANIRVIGQAPVVGKNIFDMVSDGDTFHIYIPSKSEFIEGPDKLEHQASKPIENLRPQHLVDALLWEPIPGGMPVLYEEASEGSNRYYILTAIQDAPNQSSTQTNTPVSLSWEISRKIWFDRTTLQVSRVENFAPGGKVASDVHYSNWLATAASPGPTAGTTTAIAASVGSGMMYPRQISIGRPSDDYQLQIEIKKLTIDEPIAADRFALKQPPGTKLVHPDEDAKEPQKP